MTYVAPATRSMTALDTVQFYPNAGSPLDISKYMNTAVPAGANGRIARNGENLVEANNPGTPIRLVGNNTGVYLPDGLDKTKAVAAVAKWRAKGINYLRLHGLENYLMVDGALYTNGTSVLTTRNYSTTRWDEVDYFLSLLKAAGIYYSVGIIGPNMGLTLGSIADRFNTVTNTSGTMTITVAGGQVTSIAPLVAGTGYYWPPTVVLNGGGGTGAKAVAIIDGTGTVTGYTVTNGGKNYGSAPTGSHLGGTGNCKVRMPVDASMQSEYNALLSDILNHVNAYTGVTMKNDTALAFVESFNESTIQFMGDAVPSQLLPLWQVWLDSRYGTISALNTQWGTSFTSFSDPTLIPKNVSFGPATNAEKFWYQDSSYWRTELDISMFQFYVAAARSAGYTGLTTTLDINSVPLAAKVYYESGGDIQTFHAYQALQDTYATGTKTRAGLLSANAPFAMSPTNILNTLGLSYAGMPRMYTEGGYSMPNRYRGEMGLVYNALGAMYNLAGVTYHADKAVGLAWGGAGNVTRAKGLYPYAYEHDPLCVASMFLGNLIFHRRDVDVVAVDKTFTTNDQALSFYANPASAPATSVYFSAQVYAPSTYYAIPFVGRVAVQWDATNDATIAANWKTDVQKTQAQLTADMGFGASHEFYDWTVTKGNTLYGSGDRPANYVLYTKNRQIFADQIAGIFGVNTPKTQVAISSSNFVRGAGSSVRNGNAYVANSPRTLTPIRGTAYKLNYLGNRFWQNLEINYIEDGVLLGITSANNKSISSETAITIALGTNAYNLGATWSANASTIVSVPVTAGGSGFTSPPDILFSGGSGCCAAAVGIISGGALTGVLMLDGGTGYVAGVTATVSGGGGTGATLGAPVLTADDPSKEVLLNVASTGAQEGWPPNLQLAVVDFNIIGVDVSRPWTLHELDYTGSVIASYSVQRLSNGIRVRIDTNATAQPSVFFQLVQGTEYRRPR